MHSNILNKFGGGILIKKINAAGGENALKGRGEGKGCWGAEVGKKGQERKYQEKKKTKMGNIIHSVVLCSLGALCVFVLFRAFSDNILCCHCHGWDGMGSLLFLIYSFIDHSLSLLLPMTTLIFV